MPSARKTEYTVKTGDTLISIARRLHSTTEAIAKVNKLPSTLIRPGEILAVPHLDFTITIDLPDQRVIVHDGHGFFTQYPIESVDLPRTRKPVVQTKVMGKSFLKDGAQVRPDVASSSDTVAQIHLRGSGYTLYGVEENNENASSEIAVEEKPAPGASGSEPRPAKGIAMLKEDIAQLEVLIRKGTPVTIVLNRE
jgi:LysM repeat protein